MFPQHPIPVRIFLAKDGRTHILLGKEGSMALCAYGFSNDRTIFLSEIEKEKITFTTQR